LADGSIVRSELTEKQLKERLLNGKKRFDIWGDIV